MSILTYFSHRYISAKLYLLRLRGMVANLCDCRSRLPSNLPFGAASAPRVGWMRCRIEQILRTRATTMRCLFYLSETESGWNGVGERLRDIKISRVSNTRKPRHKVWRDYVVMFMSGIRTGRESSWLREEKEETGSRIKLSQTEQHGFIIIIPNKRMHHGHNIASEPGCFHFLFRPIVPFSLLTLFRFMRRLFRAQAGAVRLSSGIPGKIHFDVSWTGIVSLVLLRASSSAE